jgi:hypothetical protein
MTQGDNTANFFFRILRIRQAIKYKIPVAEEALSCSY